MRTSQAKFYETIQLESTYIGTLLLCWLIITKDFVSDCACTAEVQDVIVSSRLFWLDRDQEHASLGKSVPLPRLHALM